MRGVKFTLYASGDLNFHYFFDYAETSEQIKGEFLKQIATSKKRLGDQVMIHLCRTIKDFFLQALDSSAILVLNIRVEL